MNTFVIQGTPRTSMGKKNSADLRRADHVPCVIYGGKEVHHFSATRLAFRDLVHTPEFKVAEIDLGSKKIRAIVKDVQFHPLTDKINHIDFLELVDGQIFKADVPVKFTGVAEGVKKGGKFIQNVRKVRIKTTPEKMVTDMEVDITDLDLGKAIRVRDIRPIEGVEVVNAPAIPLALVEIPRALRSAQTEETKEAGKKK